MLGSQGYEQKEGLDCNETFAAVVKPATTRLHFAIAAEKDREIEQMNVKTAFRYGRLHEKVYVEQPTGYNKGSKSANCRSPYKDMD